MRVRGLCPSPLEILHCIGETAKAISAQEISFDCLKCNNVLEVLAIKSQVVEFNGGEQIHPYLGYAKVVPSPL